MGRPTQPSGTNRPSSYSIPPPADAGRACGRGPGPGGAFERCAALRARTGGPADENAPCWPAAMAGEAHPVPSRTRKLSPLAPMVLRCSPWESRTPPASKGRFRFARVRAGPRGGLPARAFFVLSGGPRADLPRLAGGLCSGGAPLAPIGLPLICPWAAAPPSIGRNDEKDDGLVRSGVLEGGCFLHGWA